MYNILILLYLLIACLLEILLQSSILVVSFGTKFLNNGEKYLKKRKYLSNNDFCYFRFCVFVVIRRLLHVIPGYYYCLFGIMLIKKRVL